MKDRECFGGSENSVLNVLVEILALMTCFCCMYMHLHIRDVASKRVLVDNGNRLDLLFGN